ncbi:hypothetical protein TNCV_91261 [Trichonephila clavipes]|nr:hypothetical protein TNCV_91261 [Trichonephila clavipes]
MPSQVSSTSLDHGSKFSPRVAEQCDVNIQSINLQAVTPKISCSSPGGATARQLLHRSINRHVSNMVSKIDANLALSPTFRY